MAADQNKVIEQNDPDNKEFDYIEIRNSKEGLVSIVTLANPLAIVGVEYKKLTLREPTVLDMLYEDRLKNIEKHTPGKVEVLYFCSLINENPDLEDFKKLKGKDYARLQQGFLSLMRQS